MRAFPIAILSLAICVVACASKPPTPARGTSVVWGELRLVPRADLPSSGGGAAYGDRRLREAKLFDYSQPGFAVVYVEADEFPADEIALTIRSSRLGAVVEPRHAAIGASGRVAVHNASGDPHIVSQPATGVLAEILPGEQVVLEIGQPGEQTLYLLDSPASTVTIFASPGPYAVVSESGRFALADLSPGHRVIHAWHPRLPAASRALELTPDARIRVDFELGLCLEDRSTEVPPDAQE